MNLPGNLPVRLDGPADARYFKGVGKPTTASLNVPAEVKAPGSPEISDQSSIASFQPLPQSKVDSPPVETKVLAEPSVATQDGPKSVEPPVQLTTSQNTTVSASSLNGPLVEFANFDAASLLQ